MHTQTRAALLGVTRGDERGYDWARQPHSGHTK